MDYRTLIDAQSLAALLNADSLTAKSAAAKPVLLDCRSNLMQPGAGLAAYQKGHLPGARHADMDTELSSSITATSGRHPLPDPEGFARQLGEWGIDTQTQVIVYDDMGGAMASRAWWLLRWMGHEQVAVLNGGVPAWVDAGGELSSAVESSMVTTPYPYRLNPSWVVDSDTVQANIADPKFTLIDARNAERFRGEQEPIDPIAGHVPGALNRPLPDNLTDKGLFKSAEQLRMEWDLLLDGVSPNDVVTMCGSGVTACHLLLSLEVAGLPGARVYAGSWSEWIRDDKRPVG
ncbi:MAG: sulfurtransferase [Motiliproteus sp.]